MRAAASDFRSHSYQGPLFLGKCRVQVEHEGVSVAVKLGDNELGPTSTNPV